MFELVKQALYCWAWNPERCDKVARVPFKEIVAETFKSIDINVQKIPCCILFFELKQSSYITTYFARKEMLSAYLKHEGNLHLSSKQNNESIQISKYAPSDSSVEIHVEKYSNPFNMFFNTDESIPQTFSWHRNPLSNIRLQASRYLWVSIAVATSAGGGSWWI